MKAIVRSMQNVQVRPVEWLWQGWIPRGKITVLDGDPDLGKSTVLLDLAARISSNTAMPDGSISVQGNVILMSAEDDDEDTVKPRLVACGADCSRISSFVSIKNEKYGRLPEIPRDLGLIKRIIQAKQAVLLIIDPLMSYLTGADSYKEQEVRRVMYWMKKIASRTNCAIICMRHFTKFVGGKALHKGSGSVGLVAAARSGLMVAEDPDDHQARVLAPTKGNLWIKPKALRYKLELTNNGACRIAWLGESKYNAQQLVEANIEPEELSARDEAKELLKDILKDGPLEAKQVLSYCKDWGVAQATMNRAKRELGIKSYQDIKHGPWYWKLKDVANDVHSKEK